MMGFRNFHRLISGGTNSLKGLYPVQGWRTRVFAKLRPSDMNAAEQPSPLHKGFNTGGKKGLPRQLWDFLYHQRCWG